MSTSGHSYWRSTWPIWLMGLIVWCCAPNYRLFSVSSTQAIPEMSGPPAGDYLQEWVGGKLILSGASGPFYDQQRMQQFQHNAEIVGVHWPENQYFPLVYPPYYYQLVAPLSLLPLSVAASLWLLLMTAALAGAVILIARECGLSGRSTVLVSVAFVLFPPVMESLVSGQKSTLLLLLFVVFWKLLRCEKSYWAGVSLGVLAIKPTLILLPAIYGLLTSSHRIRFVSGIMTTGIVFLAMVFSYDAGMLIEYWELRHLLAEYQSVGGFQLTESHTLSAMIALVESHYQLGTTFVGEMVLVLLQLTVFVAWGCGLVALRSQEQAVKADFGIVLTLLATLLLSPHLYTYDLSLLLLLVPVGLHIVDARMQISLAILVLTLLVGSTVVMASGIQITVLGMLTVLILFVNRICSEEEIQSASLRPKPANRPHFITSETISAQ